MGRNVLGANCIMGELSTYGVNHLAGGTSKPGVKHPGVKYLWAKRPIFVIEASGDQDHGLEDTTSLVESLQLKCFTFACGVCDFMFMVVVVIAFAVSICNVYSKILTLM